MSLFSKPKIEPPPPSDIIRHACEKHGIEGIRKFGRRENIRELSAFCAFCAVDLIIANSPALLVLTEEEYLKTKAALEEENRKNGR